MVLPRDEGDSIPQLVLAPALRFQPVAGLRSGSHDHIRHSSSIAGGLGPGLLLVLHHRFPDCPADGLLVPTSHDCDVRLGPSLSSLCGIDWNCDSRRVPSLVPTGPRRRALPSLPEADAITPGPRAQLEM